jgi:hypothetical protein
MDYGHLCQLKILKEIMHENPRCINCPPNSNQWIQIKRWLHGSFRIFFLTQLERPCYTNLAPNNQAMVQPMNLNLQTPKVLNHNTKLSYFKMLGKTIITIGLQLVLWIYNAHGIEQGTLGEAVVQLFDQLGRCSFKLAKTIEKQMLQIKTHIVTCSQITG